MVYRRFLVDRGDQQEPVGFEHGTLVERRPEVVRYPARLVHYREVARYSFAQRYAELSPVLSESVE